MMPENGVTNILWCGNSFWISQRLSDLDAKLFEIRLVRVCDVESHGGSDRSRRSARHHNVCDGRYSESTDTRKHSHEAALTLLGFYQRIFSLCNNLLDRHIA